MEPIWQFIFYGLAVVCFVIEASAWRPTRNSLKPAFGWLGLALFAFPFAYTAATQI